MAKQAVIVRSGDGEELEVLQTKVRFVCQGGRTERAWSLLEAVLPRGGGPPLHEHPWDEAYYVVQGRVRFTVGTDTVEVAAGDFLYAPGGTLHAFEGISETPARLLVFDAPSAAEGFFRDCAREVTRYPDDLAKVPEIGARHQLRFVL